MAEVSRLGDVVRIVVTGKPVPWARAGKHGSVHFTPPKVRLWQTNAAQIARQIMSGRAPSTESLQLVVRAEYVMPSSWPRWKRELGEEGLIGHVAKPDGDNLVKNAKDALNGIVYVDDSQITKTGVVKAYRDIPRVVITIRPLAQFPSTIKKRPSPEEIEAVRRQLAA